ncbi:MAG: hypothetical protein ACOC0R_06465 [Mariniphaga sp.]
MELPAAEQAPGPFVNPVEQNKPDETSVLMHFRANKKSSCPTWLTAV